jgi:hypothetical protein
VFHQEYWTSERRRLKARKILVGLVIVAFLISACRGGLGTSTPETKATQTPVTRGESVTAELEQFDQARTLASLTRVDDFPLYEMHYYGDYDFGNFLQGGIQADNLTHSYTQRTVEKWACTCFAALNEEGDSMFGRNFDWYVHPV